MKYSQRIIPSPLGDLIAVANETHLVMLEFADSPWLKKKVSIIARNSIHTNNFMLEDDINNQIIERTQLQLREYFSWTRTSFGIPLAPSGTDFQKKAWEALQQIPYGETRSYQEEAILAGNPKAVRAIGWANNKNPIVIIIPCHRVIGADGSLVGYGWGMKRKVWLLEHEKQ